MECHLCSDEQIEKYVRDLFDDYKEKGIPQMAYLTTGKCERMRKALRAERCQRGWVSKGEERLMKGGVSGMDIETSGLGLVVRDERVVVSSRDVARVFEKRHTDVLRSVKLLGCSSDFNQRNFASVEYCDSKGEMRPEFLMARDGFTLLAMGYTGSKAMQFKEAYIAEFNRMEGALNAGIQGNDRARMLMDLIKISKGSVSISIIDAMVNEAAAMIMGRSLHERSGVTRGMKNIGNATERALTVVRNFVESTPLVSAQDELITSHDLHEKLAGWCVTKGLCVPSKHSTGRALRILGWKPQRGTHGIRLWGTC